MHCESKVRYFYWEFDCIFLFLRAVVNILIKTLIAMTLTSQDNHLTAGAWATCVGKETEKTEVMSLKICMLSVIWISDNCPQRFSFCIFWLVPLNIIVKRVALNAKRHSNNWKRNILIDAYPMLIESPITRQFVLSSDAFSCGPGLQIRSAGIIDW